MSVNEVLDAVRALSPEERAQVRELIESLPSEPSEAEENARRMLVNIGLLTGNSDIVLTGGRRSPRRSPVEIKGKPLSETIIEERR